MNEVGFSHLSATGEARMVDVSAKDVTARTATAAGAVRLSLACVSALREAACRRGTRWRWLPRIAGSWGKAHARLDPVVPSVVDQWGRPHGGRHRRGVDLVATVRTTDRTGVEMEALTAVPQTHGLGVALDRHPSDDPVGGELEHLQAHLHVQGTAHGRKPVRDLGRRVRVLRHTHPSLRPRKCGSRPTLTRTLTAGGLPSAGDLLTVFPLWIESWLCHLRSRRPSRAPSPTTVEANPADRNCC